MTESLFLTYEKYNDKNQALELIELLNANKIEFQFENTSAIFDPSFANDDLSKEYRLKLKKNDFERVDKLLLNITKNQIKEVENNYYLFDFTDTELIEVLTRSDEWSKFDYLLAQKILKDRGQEINEKVLETLRKQRIKDLAQPEESQKTWIIAGYLLSIFGGLIGIVIGWHLRSFKKTLPNGDRVYGYSVEDRNHGTNIFVVGIIFFFVWLLFRILTE